MDKETLVFIGVIFRWLIGALGLVIVIVLLARGFRKKENKEAKKVGSVFLLLLLIALGLIEFLLLLSLFPFNP